MPKIQWQKNLHDLHQKTDLVSWKETRNVFYRKDKVIGRVYAVLTLKVQEFDSMVGCKVQSSAGRTVAKARITVHEPPRAPCKYKALLFVCRNLRAFLNSQFNVLFLCLYYAPVIYYQSVQKSRPNSRS